MPGKGSLVFLASALFIHTQAFAGQAPRLLFTGDILLAREVQREITLKHGQSPWARMGSFFKDAAWVMGNFEGSVGTPESCLAMGSSLCFAVAPSALSLLRDGGFTALAVENNHSGDLGPDGRKTTRVEFGKAGLATSDYEFSPGFFKCDDYVFSFVAFNTVKGRDGQYTEIPSPELRQKLRLARALSDWVIVNVHWGAELTDWPQVQQREMAKWLIENGADVILGHHPHVVQAAECVAGKPVFFSLGNHVFDQKYPATKEGLIAECTVNGERLACAGVATTTLAHSSFPELAKRERGALDHCAVPKQAPLVVDGYRVRPHLADRQFRDGEIILEGTKVGSPSWTVVAKRLLAVEKGRFDSAKTSKDYLFTLESHHSSIDKEDGPRPYVYEVSPHGLVAKWRGSALAWPLIDTSLLAAPSGDRDYLCALHRKDSFILLNQKTKETRTAVYEWNGFGFAGVGDKDLKSRCDGVF